MLDKRYYALDVAKFISAFLVICIHTAPLQSINADANFVLVQIVARLAVPLFFIISGFLFFSKLDTSREWNDYENMQKLRHYLWRIAKIYLIWTILYLPFTYLLLRGEGFSTASLLGYVRDFFFNGSYYHLWFLPALLLGMCVVYFLRSHLSMRLTLVVAVILYLLGMAGNIYGAWLEQVPVVSDIYRLYTEVFTTTRNGLFFGVMFLSLGAYFAERRLEVSRDARITLVGFIGFFALLCAECWWLRQVGLMQELSSMYLMLIPTASFLFLWLIELDLRPHPLYRVLRILSLLLYVSHIMFVVVLFALFPQGNTLYIYLLSTAASLVCSLVLYWLSKKCRLLKHLY